MQSRYHPFLIGGDIMKKKLIPILLIAILIINMFPVKKTQAVGEGAFLRVVGGSAGERILIGIGEKAGVKFGTKKAQQEAVERWNLELYRKIEEAEKYGRQHEADQLKALNIKLRQPGELQLIEGGKNAGKDFGQVIISAALFLTGLDIVMDVSEAIETSVNTQVGLETLKEYGTLIEEGKAYSSIGPYTFFVAKELKNNKTMLAFGNEHSYKTAPHPHFSYDGLGYSRTGTLFTGVITGVVNNTYKLKYSFTDYETGKITEETRSVVLAPIDKFLEAYPEEVPDFNIVNWQPLQYNIPSAPSLPWVTPWRDNPDTNKPVIPDEIPIEIPLTDPDTYSPGEPWNDPMPNYDPIPGDDPGKDKDYIPGIPINPTPGTEPGKEPGGDTGPNLTPKPGKDVLPTPEPMPEPGTSTPTDPTIPEEEKPKSKPGDTQNRFAALITNKFPFSLPWDIGNMLEPLLADPVRPNVKLDVSFDAFGKEVPIKFSHDFKWMDDFIGFFRIFILIGFNLFMITSTRKLMGGGQ